jgi:tetratricopeptide (TPR) repeat protein
MWWYLLPGIIAFFCLATLAVVAWRVFPRLVIIDVATIAHERDAERKQQIILDRAERLRLSMMRKLKAHLRPLIRAAHGTFERWYAQAIELERRYRHIGATPAAASIAVREQADATVAAGLALFKAGKVQEAEQKFVEAISIQPKCTKAYESLGRLYVQERQWDEAFEAFQFLLRMDANDASVYANLGELAVAQGNTTAAIAHFEKAVSLKPANPQLQALLLNAAIEAKQKELARATFGRLKEISPQFPRLAEFEERLRTM